VRQSVGAGPFVTSSNLRAMTVVPFGDLAIAERRHSENREDLEFESVDAVVKRGDLGFESVDAVAGRRALVSRVSTVLWVEGISVSRESTLVEIDKTSTSRALWRSETISRWAASALLTSGVPPSPAAGGKCAAKPATCAPPCAVASLRAEVETFRAGISTTAKARQPPAPTSWEPYGDSGINLKSRRDCHTNLPQFWGGHSDCGSL